MTEAIDALDVFDGLDLDTALVNVPASTPTRMRPEPTPSTNGNTPPPNISDALAEFIRATGAGPSEELAQLSSEVSLLKRDLEELRDRPGRVEALEVTNLDTGESHRVESPHPELSAITRTLTWSHCVLLIGPAGTGKTTIGLQANTALFGPDSEAHVESFTAGKSPADIVGRMDAHGVYHSTSFIHAWTSGRVIILDEIDAADPNMALMLNAAIANGILATPADPNRSHAVRHPDTRIIAAANTDGKGATQDYSGREQMDGAFLDRYAGAIFQIDYPRQVEADKLAAAPALAEILWTVRANLKEHRIDRMLSTRAFDAASRMLAVGYSPREALDAITRTWTQSETDRALSGCDLDTLDQ